MNVHIEFLRPWWFLALIPIAWLLWNAWQIKTQQGRWHKIIEPKFQTLLLGSHSETFNQTNMRLAVIGLGFIWVLAITALAGPSLKSVKLPAEKIQQGSVVILDLSLSMLADDFTPNRISRARFKLVDLLNKHPELPVGLVGYAGTAHSIAPISEDNQTLLEMLPVLNPLIMPQYGSNPLEAMKLAEQMFTAAQINQGHLIWVTDDLEPSQRKAIQSWLNRRNLSLSILAIGTQAGGTVNIPNYGLLRDDNEQIITPELPYLEFQKLSRATGAALTPIKVDESDLAILLPNNLGAIGKEKQEKKSKEVLHKLDEGAGLIIALMLMLAFAYRRGWLFTLPLLMIMPISAVYSPPSYAESNETKLPDFAEVFETPDQQGYEAWQQQKYQAAEALFESPEWKGATLYRLGKYNEAANQFKQDTSAKGHYNLGNAQAKLGNLEDAKKAYEQALKLQPDFSDAQSNLELINQLLEQQNQTESSNSGMESDDAASNQAESKENQKTEPEKSNKEQTQKRDQTTSKDQNPSQSGLQENLQNDPQDNPSAPPEKEGGEQQETTDSEDQGQAKEEQSDQKDQASSTQLKGEESKQGNQPNPKEHSEEAEDGEGLGDKTETTKNNEGTEDADAPPSPDSTQGAGLDENASKSNQSLEEIQAQEQQRATDNWLKQIPDQPGLFLKRKFEYQYQQQNNPNNRNNRNNSNQNGQKNPLSNSAEKIW